MLTYNTHTPKHIPLKRMSNIRSFFLFLFFTFFGSLSSVINNHICSQEESNALLLFKQNLSSINSIHYTSCENWLGSGYYPIMKNWNTDSDCCDWGGVTCDNLTGHVIGLDLSCGMLQGTFHSNSSLFHLPHLRTLNLAFNDFTGSQIPREIGRLSNTLTQLNISRCGFIGHVPSEVSLLHKLVSLDLSQYGFLFMRLEPHVFSNLLQNATVLEQLSLASVYISATLPAYLNISSSLRLLNLQDTRLRGKLPRFIFNLQSLENLDLSDNYFIGYIPCEITRLPKLVSLDFSYNDQLEIEPHIFNSVLQNLTFLRELSLHEVNIGLFLPTYLNITSSLKSLSLTDTGLKGKLPDNIFNLQNLEKLDLAWNDNLTGPLPKVNTSINSPLKYLSLAGCNMSGFFPHGLFSLQSLEELYLSQTNLSSPFPKVITHTNIPLKKLYLLSCGLMGSLPSWLFSLQSLEDLVLSNNKLSGQIDVLDQGRVRQTFRQLTNLSNLDLSYNNFTGKWELDTLLSSLTKFDQLILSHSGLSVMDSDANHKVISRLFNLDLASCKMKVFPDSLRTMKNIEILDLSDNQIHGRIPHWVGEIQDHLYVLNISFNQIQGPIPISICNMNSLRHLDMSNNSFGGVIPRCFGNITSSLRAINLMNNHFQGTIPDANNDCQNLEGFILNGNHFEGEVPSSLSKCRSLKVVDLGNNHLNGTFPQWLGDLQNLQVLVLKSNNFHGPIVTSCTHELPFQHLQVLDLSHNGFAGQLPKRYFQNFKTMKNAMKKSSKPEYLQVDSVYYSISVIDKGVEENSIQVFVGYTIINLSNNRFKGEIPNIIGSLNSLKTLNLSHNNLNGRIPHSLGNISEIESLDLSSNQLIGEIPRELANIKGLAVLNVSQNHLIGRIPQGPQFNTFDASSFVGNLGLCGFPLPKCERPSSQQDKGDGYDDDDDEIGFTWEVVLLGYGCGTLIGLVLGCLMLSTGKPKWFNEISNSIEHMILKRRKKRRYGHISK